MKEWMKILLLLVAGVVAGWWVCDMCVGHQKVTFTEREVRDTVVITDTVRITDPRPSISRLLGYRTVTVSGPEVTVRDTVVKTDSVRIELPVVQNIYETQDYKAWVSGIEANLDSLHLYSRTEMVNVKVKEPPKRWHLGPAVGVGAGVGGLTPWIGVSLTYSVLSF